MIASVTGTARHVGLGYSSAQAESAVERAASSLGDDPDVSAALRASLRELAG